MSIPTPPGRRRWLALDTSTAALSIALGAAGADTPLAYHGGEGGPQASARLLPAIVDLLRQLDWPLAALDGMVFGCGPGSFTGLRTACAVVQGLAAGARPGGVPVLPLSTLLAVAEAARHTHAPEAAQLQVWAALDARMDEVYVARYAWRAGHGWQELAAPRLSAPEALPEPDDATTLCAGNVGGVYAERLPAAWRGALACHTLPDAAALLRLAAQGIERGLCVPAAHAQPLYVRDKVALDVHEQAALRAARGG